MKELLMQWDRYKDWLKQDEVRTELWYMRERMGYNFSDFMKWLESNSKKDKE